VSEPSERPDGASDDDDPQEGRPRDRSEQGRSPGVDALQAAAREAIDATRALLDVAEALVNDPEMADRLGSVVRAASGAAARAARAAGTDRSVATDGPDDDGDGVQRIPVS
jgi:hypothetical protein